MSNPIDFRTVAAQLAKPEGEEGVKTAEHMNISNADMTRHAIDLLDCREGDHVLEIGPGNGRFAAHVLSKAPGIRYTGADISSTMVETARKINRKQIDEGRATFIQVNGVQFPFPDSSFNKVFTVNTLYFWANPAVQLAEIKRLLKPQGTWCLAIASKAFMETLPFAAYGFTLYTPEEAQQLLAANGFTVVDTIVRQHPTTSAHKQEVLREEIFILAQ
ncbi:Ubiquinone/menaquinone biosynthesis C-methylase UbiE [Parapedobacter composti]|uniref:Ubiquinone/menaquinone biosynthesis C-methylase UbiE n=1 Tax=Parapedobacter composti TaxID=623281 RepID=A0A1I1F9K4_9SPHI|nr:class I SAM-dependent methyltransferase [Parapedobacter composti]SFB95971.1 Ubiquinone/menaquinone biosynthesis C-methylase UbiE [Parapedobacter composti]